MNHETTIQKIQSLVPDVMKKEDGCRISVTADGYGSCNESVGSEDYSKEINEVGIIVKGCNKVVFRDNSPVDDVYVSSVEDGYEEDYEMTFKILGKPITLSVVLRAIGTTEYANKVGCDATGEMQRVEMYENKTKIKVQWNLSKDNFNDQSEETKAFIGRLIN